MTAFETIRNSSPTQNRYSRSVAFVAGGLLPLAFSPFDLWLIAPLSFAALLYSLHGKTPRAAYFVAWLFGLGQLGIGVSWVYISMHQFGHIWAPVAGFLSVSFSAFIAAVAALSALFAGRLAQRFGLSAGPQQALFVFLWVAFEWLRGWVLSGFPWLSLGYSQTDGPLAGWVPVLGVYGVSLLLAGLGVALYQLIFSHDRGLRWVLLAISIPLSGLLLAQIQWAKPSAAAIDVTILQGNYSQDIKWLPSHRNEQLAWYFDQTMANLDGGLVIWPETAAPAFHHQIKDNLLARLERAADKAGSGVLAGMPVKEGAGQYYNGVFGLGKATGQYLKYHLVPLGEYFPLKGVLALIPGLDIPLSDMQSGDYAQPLIQFKGQKIAISICYEDVFGDEFRRRYAGASVLVNVSNDAWFGETAPHQHLQMARMRAMENARYLLRATNTGVSAVVNQLGEVQAQAPQLEPAVLKSSFVPYTGNTPYALMGNWPILGLLVFGAILVIYTQGPRARREQ